LPTRYSAKDGLNRESIYCELYKETYTEIAALLLRNGLPLKTLERRLMDLSTLEDTGTAVVQAARHA
jgi:hypothetical protein